MSQQITKGEQPFVTTDQELALSLFTAGCTPADIASDGPCTNVYTPNTCRNRWKTVRNPATGEPNRVPLLPHKPVTPEDFERAVMRAGQLRIPGDVTYAIKKDSIFVESMTAHDKMAEEFEVAKRDNRAPTIPNLSTLTEAAMIMVVCYIRRKNAHDMKAMAWVRSPRLALGDVKKEVTPIEGAPNELLEQRSYTGTNSSGLKLWDLNLSDSARAKIMGDGKPFLHPRPKL